MLPFSLSSEEEPLSQNLEDQLNVSKEAIEKKDATIKEKEATIKEQQAIIESLRKQLK